MNNDRTEISKRNRQRLANGHSPKRGKKRTQSKPERSCEATDTQFTIVTSNNPRTLTKSFQWIDQVLVKTGGGMLVSGVAETRSVDNLEQFSKVIEDLGPEHALIYGVTKQSPVQLTTSAKWEAQDRPTGTIPRTNEHFSYPKGSGIFMFDYDPPADGVALTKEQFIAKLRQVVPDLRLVDILWWASASSHIFDKSTSSNLTGLRGQRIYVIAANAADIPRAAKAISRRLWLAGQGHIKVSSCGSLLLRTLTDESVYQPNRLDFAAGADCEEPLVQKRGRPVFTKGEKTKLDTRHAIPDLSANEERSYEAIVQAAKVDKQPEADQARMQWIEQRALETAGEDASQEALEAARRNAESVLSNSVLRGSFLLHVHYLGRQVQVTVSEVLANPKKFDRCQTLDPIEPDYDGGRRVGILYLLSSRPVLHSFARGEATYYLENDVHSIAIVSGKLVEAVDATLVVLRNDLGVYDRGEDFVLVVGGRQYILDQHSLQQELARIIQYFALKKNKDGIVRILLNPPADLAKRLLSMGSRRRLKSLLAVISAPTLRQDGSILQEVGYDQKSALYLDLADASQIAPIKSDPTLKDVSAALHRLWHAFQEFPFAAPVDRSVLLAALLTASVRRSLKTAPAFGFDAPVQGSGKSLLAACIAALATGAEPRLFPHTEGKTDEEVRKRLMSFFREGYGAMVWDNVMGIFDSASFAAALTSADFTDRILGKSQTVSSPTRAMILMTGNNLIFKGDMVRRVLTCRINANTERPHDRKFDVDPLEYVLGHRLNMILDCLTILRGALTHSHDAQTGRLASFEDWSDLVRSAVVWVGAEIAPGEYVDPVGAIDTSMASDPDLEALGDLLSALYDSFKDNVFGAADVVRVMETSCSAVAAKLAGKSFGNDVPSPIRLREAIRHFSDTAVTSASSLGRIFAYRKDRIQEGLVLRASNNASQKKKMWRVVVVPEGIRGIRD